MSKLFLPLFIILFSACGKKTNEVLSGDKIISSVSFNKSDNPALSADVTGQIVSDSVKFELPSNIPLTALKPSVSFVGKKLEPATGTAQDFSNGKSYVVTAADGTTKQYWFSVKQISTDTAVLALGTWRVLKDSVTNNNWINPAGGYLVPGVYIGKPADYWKFEANGVFSAQENGVAGVTTYKILPNKKLDIPWWTPQYGMGTIEKISSKEFSVFFSATSSNGGKYYRKVYLER